MWLSKQGSRSIRCRKEFAWGNLSPTYNPWEASPPHPPPHTLPRHRQQPPPHAKKRKPQRKHQIITSSHRFKPRPSRALHLPHPLQLLLRRPPPLQTLCHSQLLLPLERPLHPQQQLCPRRRKIPSRIFTFQTPVITTAAVDKNEATFRTKHSDESGLPPLRLMAF